MSWENVFIEDVFLQIRNGASIKQTDGLAGIPITRIETIADSKIDVSRLGYANIQDNSYKEYYLEEGDILMSHINSWSHLGKNAIVHDINMSIIHGMNLLLLKANQNLLNPKYAKYYFDTNSFKQQLHKISNQSVNQSSFSSGKLKRLKIPLPPLPVQQRIAEILDTADALRRKDQELLKKYDELAQAIFIDMFGDPVKNEKGWEVKTIEQIVKKERHSIKRGPFGGALKKDIFVSSGFLVYEQYHALNNDFTFQRYFINEQKYKELIAFDVKPGDIIISCSGIYLGKLSIVPENALPGIINQALLKISLDNKLYNSEFFIKVFSQKNFKEKYFASERGAAIPNFPPMSAFKEFRFICPPIEMQNEYLGIVNNIKKQVDQINYQISNSDRLFQNLILKSFSGELVN